jgi:RHS repeat-associated protein
VTSYVYDDLGQLISVNDPHDSVGGPNGTIWEYGYDYGGNILQKKIYLRLANGSKGTLQKTLTYTYDSTWKDKLVSITETVGGTSTPKAIGYGSYSSGLWDMGNPATYDGWTYEWQAGRQLKSMTHKNAQNVQDKKLDFLYDAGGLRTQKKLTEGSTVTTTDYTLHGKLLMHQRVSKVVNSGTPDIKELHFFYDAQSRPQIVNFNGLLYTYVHNLQGDIVAIVDKDGVKVVEYKYDAWGKPLSGFPTGALANTLGKLNQFRYRAYVYDEESSLYYLRSRYYNPEWGRFINADALVGTGGLLSHNILSYCQNNPINYHDKGGQELVAVGGAVAAGPVGWVALGIVTIIVGAIYASQPARDYPQRAPEVDIPKPTARILQGPWPSPVPDPTPAPGPAPYIAPAPTLSPTRSPDTKIYRYGYGAEGIDKLVPTEEDVDENSGLSFSTKPGRGAAMTTINTVNATGVLRAVQDGKTHVSVYPIGGTVSGWRKAGTSSVWTQTLKRICVLW